MASMFSTSEMSNIASTLLSTYASFAGTLMLLRSMARELIPEQLRSYFSFFHYLFTPPSTNLILVINESSGVSSNEVYNAADLYLATKISPKTERLKLSKTERQKNFGISIEKDEEVVDIFEGIELKWRYNCIEPREKAKQIKEESKVVKMYNRDCPCGDDDTGIWGSMNLEHPATFDTVAMDSELKKMIIDDLERHRKIEFDCCHGHYLKFDIYDLELASIYSNSDLRNVLLSTTNRSIIVIEDIDCSIQVQDRENRLESDNSNRRLTLSGVLNFIDGLWSSCGDEKIIVSTTNHKDRLDPALLRPGRMDVHINLSYCTVEAFRILASNYLDINNRDHPLFGEIESLIQSTEVTPAEVAEELMRSEDADLALQGLVNFLKHKRSKCDKIEEEVAETEEANSLKSDNEEKEISVRRKRRRGIRIATRRQRGKGGTKD
ncbi:hypothetical protein SLEP1_g49093 [Rubroshorea leprosula]|uniref:ATPase AAA-type core domain-containing protein n=1 Tax=Rubroshorea leprosula TaxID=152421 RepID=A0AAV5LYP4_9ROSI|nr:hypothetical protein SLEP1_g49093 [Rubroshorea leprosula]